MKYRSFFTFCVLSASVLSGGVIAAIVPGQPADLILGRRYDGHNGFDQPSGIAVDAATHKVFISDSSRHRVLRFASAAALNNGSAAEAVLGQPDFQTFTPTYCVTPGKCLDRFNSPGRLHCDAGGRLWVCDVSNHRVLRFDNAATIPSGSAAKGQLGNGASFAASISKPEGLATDTLGNLYVSDSYNNRVLRFNAAALMPYGAPAGAAFGQPSLNAGGPAASGSDATEFHSPRGLAIEGSNTAADPLRLYVADYWNERVVRFDYPHTKGTGAAADVLYGQPDFGFTGTVALDASRIHRPVSLAIGPGSVLYVAAWEDRRVLCYFDAKEKSGAVDANKVLGADDLNSKGAASPASDRFIPGDVAVDGSAQLWVADPYNKRALRWANPSAAANGAAASGVLGAASFSTAGNNWFSPESVAVDPVSGKVFVLDGYNNRVLRYASTGALTSQSTAEAVIGQTTFAGTSNGSTADKLSFPGGITVDGAGRLWVADTGNSRVLRFNNAAAKPSGASADGVLGQMSPNGGGGSGGGPAAGTMNNPHGLAAGAGGRLWVADHSYNRILRFDNAAAKSNGAPADGVLGQPGFGASSAVLSSAGLYGPQGLCEDAAGNLFVADTQHERVLGWSNAAAAADGASAAWVFGQAGFLTDAPGAMSRPSGVAIDAAGRLYVAASMDGVILWFDKANVLQSGRTKPDGGLGKWYDTFQAKGTAADRFDYPVSVSLDSNGSLYVADQLNRRVLRFLGTAPVVTAMSVASDKFSLQFKTVPGQAYDIWRSGDLQSWVKDGTYIGMTGFDQALWISSGSVSALKRQFFRVRVP